jgi:DNA-binding NarL/FixJ family response regulator
MTQRRRHRPAFTDTDAARHLRKEADEGRLDLVATDAVLSAAGQATSRTRAGGPAGLTAREVDVLSLLAQGLPNKAIARALQISPKTIGNHLERIYLKLGLTNRAAATMRAERHGLVSTGPASIR